LQRKKVI